MNKLWNLRDRAGRRKVVEKNTKAQDYWFQKHLFYFKVSRHYFRREREHTVFRLWHEAAFPSNHWWMDLERFSPSLSHSPPQGLPQGCFHTQQHSQGDLGSWAPLNCVTLAGHQPDAAVQLGGTHFLFLALQCFMMFQYQFKPWLLCFWCSSLPICLGRQLETAQVLGTLHPYRD